MGGVPDGFCPDIGAGNPYYVATEFAEEAVAGLIGFLLD
jgi:hypothetical protein